MKRKINLILLIFIMIISLNTEVKADNKIELSSTNIEQLSNKEIIDFMDLLMNTVINKNANDFIQYKEYFTEETYNDFMQYIKSNDVYGSLKTRALDFVNVQDSNTGDSVIMANYEIITLNSEYSLAYLYEFHVNSEGKIYGYNVWVY